MGNNNPVCVCVRLGEYVAFYDRLVLVRKCDQLEDTELTSRTNVLLVRQHLLSPGNGVLLTYSSQKNNKKSHHQGNTELLLYWLEQKAEWHVVTELEQ